MSNGNPIIADIAGIAGRLGLIAGRPDLWLVACALVVCTTRADERSHDKRSHDRPCSLFHLFRHVNAHSVILS